MLPTNNQEQSAINNNDNLTNQPQTNDSNPSTQSIHVIGNKKKNKIKKKPKTTHMREI